MPSDEPAQRAAPLGIVVALAEEARCLGLRRPAPGLHAPAPGLLVAVSGMGEARAHAAAAALIRQGAGALLSFGTAGGLAPGLRPGAILVPAQVACPRGRERLADPAWTQRLRQHLPDLALDAEPRLLCVDAPVRSPADKQQLHQSSGAHAVDMESMAVAEAAHTRGRPFAALKVVVDAAGHSLPTAVLEATDEAGGVSVARLLAGLALAPGQIAPLWRLVVSFRSARSGLTHAARQTGGRFGWHGIES